MKTLIACVVVFAVGSLAPTSALAFQADSKNSSGASSSMVRAQDPQSVAAAMLAGNYQVKIGTDKVGDPMITSAANGTTFQIFFYNCTARKDCATITFNSGYALQTDVSMIAINEWNKAKRFGRAYIDAEGDPIIQMDVDLDYGGLSRALFLDNVEFWTTNMAAFERHIGYRK